MSFTSQDGLYQEAVDTYNAALERLAFAYEADPDKRRDLLQEVRFALWRSFEKFAARCSLRTWVYRVAHNTAISHVIRQKRMREGELQGLEDIESMPEPDERQYSADGRLEFGRLIELIHALKPLDRQLMLLYLEDLESAEIGEIMGLSAGHVRTQIHRIKAILKRRFHEGGERG